ncbi:hypothetical protein BB559_002533 [Furculomyces boomerangus]|uniref:NAD+ kinase n=2 Tax=Harpellales TaxID=61421 RepID=A0A2T9YUK0_9FUNG|nr:hypothetical protein BB559_002533 [Furculomyces boomerangus]PWA01302.1 hypothetical protein BB558_002610 [Smittium angustum]
MDVTKTPHYESALMDDNHAKWINGKPSKALVVMKSGVETTVNALKSLSTWMNEKYPYVTIYVESSIVPKISELGFRFEEYEPDVHKKSIDFIITLGGDGTLLRASSLFQEKIPPILSFSMGTLGFLLPFDFKNFKNVINSFINDNFYVMYRMRLGFTCHKANGDNMNIDMKTAMNEVTIHRGHFEHLTTLNTYINDQILTTVVADGLVVSTPSGSTAYSLSAGGPLMHPALESTVITPICPRSLSFRSIVLPIDAMIKLELSKQSRGYTTLVADGMYLGKLSFGDYISIKSSEHPIPCITLNATRINWVNKVNQMLKFNQTFSSSNFVRA